MTNENISHIIFILNVTCILQPIWSQLNWPISSSRPTYNNIDQQTLFTLVGGLHLLSLLKHQSLTRVLFRTALIHRRESKPEHGCALYLVSETDFRPSYQFSVYLHACLFSWQWTPEGRRLVTGASSGEFTLWNGLTFNFETILQVCSPRSYNCYWI